VTLLDWREIAGTPAGLLLTLAIAVVYPVLGWMRFRRLERRPDPLPRREKLMLYFSIVVSQWTLVGAVAVVLGGAGRSLVDVGLGVGPSLVRTIGLAVGPLAGFALMSYFTIRSLSRATSGDLPPHVARAGRILPRDAAEVWGFIPVALTAGICEEILYRGWLPWALSGFLGRAWVGFAVAALFFGFGHLYQGRNGVVITGILALGLGAITLFTRSLLPGMALHIAIDLVNGIAVGAALARMARGRRLEPPAPAALESGT